ncbi:serine O-acetyltransferase [Pseudomonas mucidolens]|uniref:serine O-acetyltransferase n=1 Tax=Pseudomonas mucidolens TaxID=46679 RepID=A0A1H2N755_9PSED|nr:serine O-acetyltransferase [Pseudomonas mucidolens]SDV00616.1 serine O-acetyltransferase [Pseudomonas mucidolens]SQH32607.1 putative serine acetyltransferase [Pseudomonas mucidolens]
MGGFIDMQHLHEELLTHLIKTLTPAQIQPLQVHLAPLIQEAAQDIAEDLIAYAYRDPASRGRGGLILESYASFKAVLYYRLAHRVWNLCAPSNGIFTSIALTLSNQGKLLSGAEIHPAARIGRRFVLDHGYGTVIGETCEIGNDCYILCGVTLGARGIANNPDGKRHPRLGNNVEVGAGARVLGYVLIGDNVFISPSCVITQDVPAGTKVKVVNQIQLQKNDESDHSNYLGAFAMDERLHVVGEIHTSHRVTVLDADFHPLPGLMLEPTVKDRHHLQFRLHRVESGDHLPRLPLNLKVCGPEFEITLLSPPGLSAMVRHLLQASPLIVGG